LLNNYDGRLNTANGTLALFSNTDGIANTAVGYSALFSNTLGLGNTAVGDDALRGNTTGDANIAIGPQALIGNSTGGGNTAIGYFSLFHNTSGIKNIALGISAGHLTTGSDNIDIGHIGVEGESSTIRIGTQTPASSHNELPLPGTQTATYIAGIHGATATNGLAVFVDMDGKLGTMTSSARFKEDISPMDKASESILALKPVTFHYKNDAMETPQFGLVAEEVAKVNPGLVVLDRDGHPYTVRYEQVNAMLLNEFLKEHRNVQELKVALDQQTKEVAALVAHIKEQDAKIQRVSDQLETSRAASQVASMK
jgi:hypothetical protein